MRLRLQLVADDGCRHNRRYVQPCSISQPVSLPHSDSMFVSCFTETWYAGLRQLAAVLLKHLIHRHWTAANPSFEQPEIAEQEKAAVRPQLLELLFQVPSNVSTPLAVCVTSIATWDFPEEWPDLLQRILSVVKSENENSSQVRHTSLHSRSCVNRGFGGECF
jgi:hypothetical protein